ncbi:MAG: YaiO family outer membrane beta-barrel protein [Alphaproteobacteria bacterium]|nr:YaiO family outer membrane beta-barrel protein [Alphaproteobacteria bacterium]
MKHYGLALFILCLCITPAQADQGLSVGQLLSESKTRAENREFDEALRLLNDAAALEPENVEVKLAVARVHSWQGRYDLADKDLRPFIDATPMNADAELLAANLDYYRERLDEAAARLQRTLAAHPDYTEVAETLELVQKAKKTAEGFLWQIDIGYERSSFARQPQPDWSNDFVQLTRFFDKGATAIYGRWEYYDQFLTTDMSYEIGVAHRFAPYLSSYFYAGRTGSPSFRPFWRVGGGGAVRVKEPEDSFPSLWLTLDLKEDEYKQTSVATGNPGVRMELGNWAVNGNMVMVREWGHAAVFGWSTRLDGLVTDGLRFYVGYANAPDTENAITVTTASIFSGFAYDVTEACTLRFGYTREDRENSYIRHVFNLGLSFRF